MGPSACACPQGYMKPLKQPENSLLCDPSLVDEIFDQIPELLEHHEQFLEQIHDCVQNWHEKQKVGDLLVQSVGPGGAIPPGMRVCPLLGTAPEQRFGSRRQGSDERMGQAGLGWRAGDDLQACCLLSIRVGAAAPGWLCSSAFLPREHKRQG